MPQDYRDSVFTLEDMNSSTNDQLVQGDRSMRENTLVNYKSTGNKVQYERFDGSSNDDRREEKLIFRYI